MMFVGRTGDGKSSTANSMHRKMGYVGKACFGEGGGACAHTHYPKAQTQGDIIFVDTPGLVDTEGEEKDERNLISMVNFAKSLQNVNLFALVINFKSPRFDHAMQAAVKLIYDSFGPGSLEHFCLVYTRCANLTEKRNQAMAANAADVVALINRRCHTSVTHMPFFYVDNHVEDLADDDVPEESIARYRKGVDQQMDDMLRLARTSQPFATHHATYGEYPARKAQREAQQKAAAAAAQARETERAMAAERAQHEAETRRLRSEVEKERADRAFANKVISANKQRQRILVSTTTCPRMEDKTIEYQRPARSILGVFGKTKTDHRTETRHTGNMVERVFAVQERDVRVLGNGEERVGSWVTVDTEVEKEEMRF